MNPYLQLMRPANLVTAVANILAGLAIAKYGFSTQISSIQIVVLLAISTIGLYGGGVVFNDVFDAKLDAIERPERPIPSGKVSLRNARILGNILFLIGIISAFLVNKNAGMIAIFITILAVFYDKYAKHHAFFGPINMGLCRGANLLLGMSVSLTAIQNYWALAIIPIIYISAITLISRGEVHGGNKKALFFAGILYLVVNFVQFKFITLFGSVYFTLPFILLHIFLIFKPLIAAIKNPIAPNIGKAVKTGVLSLIVMDAAWVTVSGNILLAISVLLLLPISIFLARKFAVT